jgi:hypothetical protein
MTAILPWAILPVKRWETGMLSMLFTYRNYTLKLCRWIYLSNKRGPKSGDEGIFCGV